MNIVSALLEGRPTKPPQGQSAEPLIQARIDSCGKDEAALQKMKLRLARAACICARQVLPKVPANNKQVCLDAIEATEAWIADPSEANALKAKEAGNVAWTANVSTAVASAAWATCVAWNAGIETAAPYAAYEAYQADPTINFPARIAAGMAEYLKLEGLQGIRRQLL